MFFLLPRSPRLGRWLLRTALGWLLVPTPSPAQTPAASALPPRRVAAQRVATPLKLDGLLEEAAWATAPVAGQFVENKPRPGRPEQQPTEVRVLYDDQALYVGAVLREASPDSVRRELTQRDNVGNTDYFALYLDPYRDHLNGYGFVVMRTGVQADGRYSPTNGADPAWNGVWDSQVAALPAGRGWSVELRIPYSAIRFAAAPVQTWGVQFGRQRKASNQFLYWNPVQPGVDGFVNQWGELTGLENLHPPLRLSLTPYVSAYLNHYPSDLQGQRSTSTSVSAGADVKWGINESFTLDATLVPDFGQTLSDNQVLNLSPFEVQYPENRAFFTEGTELFNKGGLFYSRRIGGQPLGFAEVAAQLRPGEFVRQNPGVTRLLNATKVSGRTRKGLGMGVFNAVAAASYATLQDSASGQQRQVLTQPLTNYNVLVLDQSLPHNSYVSLVNTNVTRASGLYQANVTAGLFRLVDRGNQRALNGQLTYARRQGRQLSGAPVDDPGGYSYHLNYAKISGTWLWNLDHTLASASYNPNDLGILLGNNYVNQDATVSYNRYQPFWKVNNLTTTAGLHHSLLYQPLQYQTLYFSLTASTTFTRSFLTTSAALYVERAGRDYYEPRTSPLGAYYVRVPADVYLQATVSSDPRRRLAYDLDGFAIGFAQDERFAQRARHQAFRVSASPRYRFSDKLNVRYTLSYLLRHNQIGYVNDGFDLTQPLDLQYSTLLGADVLLGRRNVNTITNTLQLNYTLTSRLSLALRVRHYASQVHYLEYARLRPAGVEESLPGYWRNHDTVFTAFNLDANLVWWFAPGSQVSVVWKNASTTNLTGEQAAPPYFDNVASVANTPHNNNVSVKVLYYLDYLTLRRPRS